MAGLDTYTGRVINSNFWANEDKHFFPEKCPILFCYDMYLVTRIVISLGRSVELLAK